MGKVISQTISTISLISQQYTIYKQETTTQIYLWNLKWTLIKINPQLKWVPLLKIVFSDIYINILWSNMHVFCGKCIIHSCMTSILTLFLKNGPIHIMVHHDIFLLSIYRCDMCPLKYHLQLEIPWNLHTLKYQQRYH